jgi:hypothetical protein
MASVDDFEREMRALDGLPAPTGRNMPRANPSGIHENRRPRSRLSHDGDDNLDIGDAHDSGHDVPFEDNEEGR